MEKAGRLSVQEFLDDIWLTIKSPASRFPVIQERGALWGSLLLLLGPAYFAFAWWGGVFFDRDPFPGYSFIAPIFPAAIVILLKVSFIHVIARLFEGRGRYTRGKGRFRSLLVVFGYAAIPQIIVLTVWLLLVLLIPATLGSAFLNLRIIAISLMVGLSIGFFIWNLILVVLALRTVYVMRDYKIVISIIAGPLLAALPVMSLMLVAGDAAVDLAQVKPILSERVLRFMAAEETEQPGTPPRVELRVDWIVYRLKAPQRFDLAVYLKKALGTSREEKRHNGLIIGLRSMWMPHRKSDEVVGRIVGLPGERVELSGGKLLVNGRFRDEPYLLQGYQFSFSYGPTTLGASDYLILPEDRRLAEQMSDNLVVPRDRILGRAIVRKWPVGWFWFRQSAFATPGD
jgi:signal peptidase I